MLGAGGRRLPGRGALCRNILGKYRGYLGKYRRESTTEISGKTGRGSSTGGSTYLRKSATRSWGKYRGGGGGRCEYCEMYRTGSTGEILRE